jgi:hypothetical protein
VKLIEVEKSKLEAGKKVAEDYLRKENKLVEAQSMLFQGFRWRAGEAIKDGEAEMASLYLFLT